MRVATVCFLWRQQGKRKEFCISRKKRTFAIDLFNGYGGKVEGQEFIRNCAVREVRAESGVRVFRTFLEKKAVVRTYHASVPQFELHVFVTDHWRGVPRETEEHGAPQWRTIEEFPFDEMLPDDRFWVPRALRGNPFEADVFLSEDGGAFKKIVFQEPMFIKRRPA